MESAELKEASHLTTNQVAPDKRWQSARSVLLGLLFGAAFLILAFRDTSFQGFVDTLQTARPRLIFLGILVYALYVLARASRWSLLLAERTMTRPFAVLFRAVTWGTAANTIIPHSGEVLRTFAARGPLGISATSILGTIAAERLYDFSTVILLTSITLLVFRESPPILMAALLAICAMGLVILAGLLLIGFNCRVIMRVVNIFTRLLPSAYRGAAQWQIDELGLGIRAAFTNRRLAWIILLSFCQWLCVTGCIYLSIESISLDVSPWLALIVLPLTIAGLSLPTAPVYLGTIQVCFLAGLTPFGISNEAAIAASVAYLSIVTIPILAASFTWYLLYLVIRRKTL